MQNMMQNIMTRGVLALMAVMAVAIFWSAPGAAQGVDVSKIPEPPVFNMSDEQFLRETDLYKETPNGDRFLTYTLRLPKGWSKHDTGQTQSMELSRRLLGEIARYYGPNQIGGQRSYFSILAAELDYEITARNWFMNYILSRGYVLQALKVTSNRKIEAIYVALQGDTSYIIRAVAEVNGTRMIMAMYHLPEDRWAEERSMQQRVVESFEFVSPEPAKVENLRTYVFLDMFRFDYPSSWRLVAPNIDGMDMMKARLLNTSERRYGRGKHETETILNGEINVHAISTELDTTLSEEVKTVQKELEDKGMLVGTLIEQPDSYKNNDHIYFSRVEVYKANDEKKTMVDYEYWIGVFMEDRYFYIVTMLSPSRNSDFVQWARNSEAFKSVVESLRP